MSFGLSVFVSIFLFLGDSIPTDICSHSEHYPMDHWLSALKSSPGFLEDGTSPFPMKSAAWLPKVDMRMSLSLDDDDRFSVSESSINTPFRSQTTQFGGRRYQFSVGLKWRLRDLVEVPERIAWTRFRASQIQKNEHKFKEVVELAMKWLRELDTYCARGTKNRHKSSISLREITFRLNIATRGLFGSWLIERSRR